MKFRAVVVELFHTQRWKDRQKWRR